MQDLKISLEGSWWDTYLYKGRLHTINIDGDLEVFDWDAIVEDVMASSNAEGRSAIYYCFAKSNAMQNGILSKDELIESFHSLDGCDFHVRRNNIARRSLFKTSAEKIFPTTSISLHYDRIITSSRAGVHVGYVSPEGIDDIELKSLMPIPTRHLAAGYGKVACASGDAGLRYLSLNLNKGFHPRETDGQQIFGDECDTCAWMYQNISATSYRRGSYLARFEKVGRGFAVSGSEVSGEDDELQELSLSDISPLDQGINNAHADSISWGKGDKIYLAYGKKVEAFRFIEDGRRFKTGAADLPCDIKDVVSVRAGHFGVALEYHNEVLILKGDGSLLNIPNEPVNISAFSNSKSYENQLHLTYDDRVDVMSINIPFEGEDFYRKAFGTKAPADWLGEL